MVIAARGSGEQPQPEGPHGDWTNPAAYTFKDTYYGAGQFNYAFYLTLKSKLKRANSQLRLSLDPVQYPADPALEAVTGYKAYEASANAGADVIQTEITRIRAACGDRVRFVLAGYSQGAWSVHKALYALGAQNDGSLDLISAVALFGDPEFEPGQVIDRGSQKGLTNSGLATPIDASRTNVPASMGSTTASYCLPHDPICQGVSPVTGLWAGAGYLAQCQAVKWAPGRCPHTTYEISGATDQAAKFVRPLLRNITPPSGGGGSSASWTAVEAPLPGNASPGVPGLPSLLHVACPSSTCAAVGSYADAAGISHTVVEWGSGSTWTPVDAPLPSDAITSVQNGPVDTGITSEACAPGASCVLAGAYHDSAGTQGLLIAGSGTSWTATKAPVPGNAATNPAVSINSVACPSAAFCVAVGSYTDSSGNQQSLLLTGSGTSWKAIQAPLPGNAAAPAYSDLASVACQSSASCVAVGSYMPVSSGGQGLLISWSGTSWAPIEAPVPGGSAPGGAGLAQVACGASACAAAGVYSYGGGTPAMLVTGSGSTWAAAQPPQPADAAANSSLDIAFVTCPGTSACVAVGSYSSGSPGALQDRNVLFTGSGSSWTVAATAPLLGGAASASWFQLSSLACGSTSACVVTGFYTDSSGLEHGMLLTVAGSSWALVNPPQPPNEDSATPAEFFNSAACPSASTCVIAGQYSPGSSLQGLLLTGPS
jgi:hypothetical protein